MNTFSKEIALILIGALIAPVFSLLCKQVNRWRNKQRIYKWLCANTRDEPGESHLNSHKIAKGTELTEDIVIQCCMTDSRILNSPYDKSLWSVWREAPQSIYEKRGLLVF